MALSYNQSTWAGYHGMVTETLEIDSRKCPWWFKHCLPLNTSMMLSSRAHISRKPVPAIHLQTGSLPTVNKDLPSKVIINACILLPHEPATNHCNIPK